MMAKKYADENVPLPLISRIRGLGHDVLTTAESGQAGFAIPDEKVLEFARETARILLTMNRRHFIRLHSISSNHSGIIVCSLDPDFPAQAQRIHQALIDTKSFTGVLIRINRPSS